MSEYETLTTNGGALADPLLPPLPPPPPVEQQGPLRSSDDVNLRSDQTRPNSLDKKSLENARKSCEATPKSAEQLKSQKSQKKTKSKKDTKGKPKNKSKEQTSNEKESSNKGLVRLLVCAIVICSLLLAIFTSFVLVIVGHLAGSFNFIPAFTKEENN